MPYVLYGVKCIDLVSLAPFSGRKVGESHRYCVEAASSVGAGASEYHSPPSCTTLTVAYNTAIKGTVLTKEARLPVEGVAVAYRVISTGSTGTTVTGKDGTFKFHVVDPKAGNQVEDVMVSFEKQTTTAARTIDHLFYCNGDLCGPGTDKETKKPYPKAEMKLTLAHLAFDSAIIVSEASSVPFSGTVSFPSVQPYPLQRGRPAPPQGSWPWQDTEGETPCMVPRARVCLLDYRKGSSPIVCDTTDTQGKFELTAPIGLSVAVQVLYKSHDNFVRTPKSRKVDHEATMSGLVRSNFVTWKNTTGIARSDVKLVEVYDITEKSDQDMWTGMQFEDHTTKRVVLGAHGTLCKLPLGDKAVLDMQHASGNCYSGAKHTVLDTTTHTDAAFLVPAHLLDVSLVSVEPTYAAATDASQIGYFHRLRNQTQRLDLADVKDEDPPVEAVFQFHPAPTLDVTFKDSSGDVVQPLACTNVTAKGDGKSMVLATFAEPRYRFKSGQVVTPSVHVKEVLQGALGQCSHVEGDVQVHRLRPPPLYPAIRAVPACSVLWGSCSYQVSYSIHIP